LAHRVSPLQKQRLLLEQIARGRLAVTRVRRLEEHRQLPLVPAFADALATSSNRTRSMTSGAARTESWQRKLTFICIGTPPNPTMSMLSQASFASPRGL